MAAGMYVFAGKSYDSIEKRDAAERSFHLSRAIRAAREIKPGKPKPRWSAALRTQVMGELHEKTT